MSTSMPVRMRNGASSSFSAATMSSCCAQPLGRQAAATVSRGEWSVSATYSWPEPRAASAISRIGEPPSDQSEWVCRSPRSAARSSAPPRPRPARLPVLQPRAGTPGPRRRRPRRSPRGDGTDARAAPAASPPRAARSSSPSARSSSTAAARPEGLDPVGRLQRPLQQVRDPPQRVDRGLPGSHPPRLGPRAAPRPRRRVVEATRTAACPHRQDRADGQVVGLPQHAPQRAP